MQEPSTAAEEHRMNALGELVRKQLLFFCHLQFFYLGMSIIILVLDMVKLIALGNVVSGTRLNQSFSYLG